MVRMINSLDISAVRKEIRRLKKENKLVIVKAQNDDFNRKILENKDVDILMSVEFSQEGDKLKQRSSGLNEVHCKLAVKNNIKIGIDLKKIINLPKKEKAKILSRIMQNIQLCKKTNAKIIVFPKNYKKQDIEAFFIVLKSSTKQAKNAYSD